MYTGNSERGKAGGRWGRGEVGGGELRGEGGSRKRAAFAFEIKLGNPVKEGVREGAKSQIVCRV